MGRIFVQQNLTVGISPPVYRFLGTLRPLLTHPHPKSIPRYPALSSALSAYFSPIPSRKLVPRCPANALAFPARNCFPIIPPSPRHSAKASHPSPAEISSSIPHRPALSSASSAHFSPIPSRESVPRCPADASAFPAHFSPIPARNQFLIIPSSLWHSPPITRASYPACSWHSRPTLAFPAPSAFPAHPTRNQFLIIPPWHSSLVLGIPCLSLALPAPWHSPPTVRHSPPNANCSSTFRDFSSVPLPNGY
ncbi:hypothetical protein R3P38DRAFT_3223804 [Favolaschia claudopus]|uniref:Uncharacterized protein n=1 Tax=Favolaschia claudopus TaxID=2862362 RepID=A0AAV9ZWA2_9AGAR